MGTTVDITEYRKNAITLPTRASGAGEIQRVHLSIAIFSRDEKVHFYHHHHHHICYGTVIKN